MRPIQNLVSSLPDHFGIGVKMTSQNMFLYLVSGLSCPRFWVSVFLSKSYKNSLSCDCENNTQYVIVLAVVIFPSKALSIYFSRLKFGKEGSAPDLPQTCPRQCTLYAKPGLICSLVVTWTCCVVPSLPRGCPRERRHLLPAHHLRPHPRTHPLTHPLSNPLLTWPALVQGH